MSMSSTNISHHHPTATHHRNDDGPAWLSAAAGLCASLVGLGLARFAYTPLIPALIAAKWFSPAEAVYLGAANLAGYLVGALIARELGTRAGSVRALRWAMVLASICCFACSMPVSFVWFSAWRFLAGVTGGVIMVLAASTILPHVAPGKRGIVGGVIFAGVGLGVAASGTLVPLLLQQGLRQTWYGLGILSAILTLVSWKAWPADVATAEHAAESHVPSRAPRLTAVRALNAEYGLNALALVPHMVFLVDFVARGLGQGITAGSHYWVLYGIDGFDPGLMHNAIFYWLGRQLPGRYSSRTRYVEVFRKLDLSPITTNDYFGLYLVEEKPKRSKNTRNQRARRHQ